MLNNYRVLRQSIHDASDLVSKRGASRRNALAVWKTSRISSLHQGFLEPLMPCKFAIIIFSVVQILCYPFFFMAMSNCCAIFTQHVFLQVFHQSLGLSFAQRN